MNAVDDGRLPAPGPDPPDKTIKLGVRSDPLWRLHDELDVLAPPVFDAGKYRFDAPGDGAEYPVTYGADEPLAPFAEVFGDTRAISASHATKRLSVLAPQRPLSVVTLDLGAVQKRFGLDARISVARQYAVTQLWSRALHAWHLDADGIRYASRHASPAHNYCLFLDRCGDALTVEFAGTIGEPALRQTVLEAAEEYSLAVMLLRPQNSP